MHIMASRIHIKLFISVQVWFQPKGHDKAFSTSRQVTQTFVFMVANIYPLVNAVCE